MGFLTQENKQKIYIYSGSSKLGLKGLKILKSLGLSIRSININNETLSNIVWIKIVAMLGMDIKDIFEKPHLGSVNNKTFYAFVVSDWLELLKKHHLILEKPIFVNGPKAKRILTEKDFFEFYGNTTSKKINDNILSERKIINNDFARAI